MTPEVAVDVFRQALQLIVLLVSAIILPGLFVGLLVAIFQAATSINEQTLSFLPRLIVTLLTMAVLAHWIFGKLMDFTRDLVANLPQLVG
jgi:flagellar biosynthetic protein FliQ